MAIHDIYSKRQKRICGDTPEVFTYDELPSQIRVQIVHIINDALGEDSRGSAATKAYEFLHKALCREYGTFFLISQYKNDKDSLFEFLSTKASTDNALDAIEMSFQYIDRVARGDTYRYYVSAVMTPNDAIKELNCRFFEHGIGYQYESGEIIRVDSKFMHSEIVKPVLSVLSSKIFAGANEEFLTAHEHYRHGRHKECLVEALKSFESTLKAICTCNGWPFAATDTAKKLITICLDSGLVPSFLQSEFTSLAAILEGGSPAVRNKLGGHGQGTTPTQVPAYMARYALNTTASCILLLAEANDALK